MSLFFAYSVLFKRRQQQKKRLPASQIIHHFVSSLHFEDQVFKSPKVFKSQWEILHILKQRFFTTQKLKIYEYFFKNLVDLNLVLFPCFGIYRLKLSLTFQIYRPLCKMTNLFITRIKSLQDSRGAAFVYD